MDDAPRVGVGDGLAHLLEDREEPAEVVGGSGRSSSSAARVRPLTSRIVK